MDLSHLQDDKSTSFSVFPGQVVAVEGMNSTGRKMTAHRICEGAAHGANKSTAKELLQFHHDEAYQNGMPLKIMSVAGPYTTSDNLNYDPLYDFMSEVLREQPDVVVMVGPFVDMRHKDIQSGNAALKFEDGEAMSVPFEALFANKVATLLEDYFGAQEDLQTQFVLVPSLDDATAEWVYVLYVFVLIFVCHLYLVVVLSPSHALIDISNLQLPPSSPSGPCVWATRKSLENPWRCRCGSWYLGLEQNRSQQKESEQTLPSRPLCFKSLHIASQRSCSRRHWNGCDLPHEC